MINFPIDFIRQIIIQTLFEEHFDNQEYYGGEQQVNLFSFYEQLQKDSSVSRYQEMYQDLVNEQNRTGLIMNGTIVSPENPTITNLWDSLIIPLTFTCAFRVNIKDRDNAITTINNLIKVLKGKKVDIAELSSGALVKVGTIASDNNNSLMVNNRDYLLISGLTFNYALTNTLNNLYTLGFGGTRGTSVAGKCFYYTDTNNTLKAIKVNNFAGIIDTLDRTLLDEQTAYENGVILKEEVIAKKYKVSMSFDSVSCNEPRILNGNEYCVIAFGGSATIVNAELSLGNDMVKVGILKNKIKASNDITLTAKSLANATILEPLEMPSSANADTQVSQLLSNKFITNTHSDNITISNQYTFILDRSISIIDQWFKYARYGRVADGSVSYPYASYVSPNIIYVIYEIWSSWGNLEIEEYNAKIVEGIDIENTESDVLSITIPFQLQGDN